MRAARSWPAQTRVAAIPKRSEDTRLSPPEQIATALTAKVRTAEPAALTEQEFVDAEETLMKLADAVASTYFISRERSELLWETLG